MQFAFLTHYVKCPPSQWTLE